MRTAAMSLILLALMAGTSEAQGNGRYGRTRAFRRGRCRAPGSAACGTTTFRRDVSRAPTSCDQAERIASRNRNARVIYGDDRYDRATTTGGIAIAPTAAHGVYPNDRTYGNTYPNSNGRYGNNSVPYDNGYRDGLEKGREDAGDRDSYDPVRHSWYRSGDRGYNSRYGTRDTYKLAYRDGFEAGYDQAYRSSRGYGATSRGVRFRATDPGSAVDCTARV